jgi:DNA invertase Pin-like site-specific DNA recombinase
VWKLDRLARSMKQLIETVETLRLRGIGFRSLTEALDTTTAQGRCLPHHYRHRRHLNVLLIGTEYPWDIEQ